ncbi:MAG: carbohydrate ABC transporter permease [Chloroflexi bacterium]|nr:carbohydrate ABC transporter permease [Chloroflexota bacterium]
MVENFSPRPLWRKAVFRRTALTLAAFAVAAVFAGPFLWMILTSLKGPKEIFVTPVRLFPTMGWYWQAYLEVWQKGNFSRYFLNSVFVASATTAISVLISVMAGLGFARYKLPGRNWLMLCILVSQLFPLVLLVPPFYVVMRNLGILDKHLSLIIAYTSFALPYSVWMLTGYFRSIPIDLEEAAMIDGCTRFDAYLRVTLPLAAPGIVATVIYCFILAWNEFLFATTFISTPANRTLPLGLQAFIGQYQVDWNLLMAGAVVTTLPVVILFVVLQRYLVAGLTAGAMKG